MTSLTLGIFLLKRPKSVTYLKMEFQANQTMKLHSQIPMWKKTIKETLNPKPTKIRYKIVDRVRTENPSN
jgi:hypothetical protein